jgi:hypothetical protein
MLAARVQRALERLYRIDSVHDVVDFIAPANEGEREVILLTQEEEGLRVELRLPEANGLDGICQVIEGVSHFVYVAERARCEHRMTQLELEMQAEVDKWVVLAHSMGPTHPLRETLFENVRFAHDAGTEGGERYRLANACAHRFVMGLERKLGRVEELRGALRRFFWSGQEDKLRLAAA